MRLIPTLAAAACAAFGMVTAAQADTVVINLGNINALTNVFFSPFNSALGTLNSVNLSVSDSISEFLSGAPYAGSAGVSGSIAFAGAELFYFPGTLDSISLSTVGTATYSNQEGPILAPATFTGHATFVDPVFAGPGLHSLILNPGVGGLSVTPSNPVGGILIRGGIAHVAHATITYNYTPFAIAVPEPSAWALMLLGFGGLGASLRQRRRRAAATPRTTAFTTVSEA